MNISRSEQRTLHTLAQGGAILIVRDDRKSLIKVECFSRDGWLLPDCTLGVFAGLKRRRLIASHGGGPYRITREGLEALRPQLDNRVSTRRW